MCCAWTFWFWWSSKNKSIKFYIKVNNLGALASLIRRFLLFCVARSYPGSILLLLYCGSTIGIYSSTSTMHILLVLYRAVIQNVKPPRTFLLYTCMTCVWVHPQLSSSLLSVAGKHYLVNPGLWTKRRHGHVFKGRLKKTHRIPLS